MAGKPQSGNPQRFLADIVVLFICSGMGATNLNSKGRS